MAGNALVVPLARVVRTRTGVLMLSIAVQASTAVACGLGRGLAPPAAFYVVVALYLVYGVAVGVALPGKQAYLNDHIPSAERATILSLAAVFGDPGGAVGQGGWGGVARGGWSWRVAVVGLGYAAAGVLFVFANKLTTAANTVFLQATNPLFVVAFAPWLLRERIRAADLALMGVLGVGLAMLFVGGGHAFATAPHPAAGNLLAAGSAVAWALTVTGYRWLARGRGGAHHGPGASAAACGNLMVFLVTLPWALPLAAGRAVDWIVVVSLGVFQLGLALVFLARAITRVPPLEASLFLLVAPVLSPA